MAKYVRRIRQGFMLYHEDVALLSNLTPGEFKDLVLAVARFSSKLASGQEANIPTFEGWMSSLWDILSTKVARDHESYRETCERRRSNRNSANIDICINVKSNQALTEEKESKEGVHDG